MHKITTGNPVRPISKISDSPILIPRNIIPNLKMYLQQKSMPDEKELPNDIVFATQMPKIIDNIIEEIGLFSKFRISIPIKSLRKIPANARRELRRIPGISLVI